ncbi:uncharacterized protein [Miscanthus floridulus]|uniref:uncharacterized protein n=1 Tax=Miscanthus floridulus TaxID=154761 RepID=UPI0034597001
MEIPARLFSTARDQGVIRPMETQAIKHHCSLYADDVIMFVHPEATEAVAVKEILRIFGEAGLKTNLSKCSITMVFGNQDSLPQLQSILDCQLVEFPITYLGLPLSTRKVPRTRIQATVDAVARRLPTCHGPLMARSGRLVWIKSVLAGPYLHHDSGRPAALGKKGNRCNMQALPLDRERRIHPRKDLGGLGVPDLYFTEIALQARWLWLRHTDEQRA